MTAITKIGSYLPTVRVNSPEQIVKNLTKIALPALIMVGLFHAPQKAEAGFGFFTACMGICMGATGGFGTMACAAACAASLAAPTP